MKPKTDPKHNQDEAALFTVLASLQTFDEVRAFMRDLCTPAERQAMADRWKVVAPLMAGEAYRTIHQQTGVSVTTIGRVARCLTEGEGGYALAFDQGGKDSDD